MKTKIILSFLLLLMSVSGFSTVWTVNNVGTSFSPATITINTGDSVNFSIDASHNALEVSLTTWNADDNTPLTGGFETNYGGGLVLPSNLTTGTHYYVCSPHASMGMKGIIIVQNCSLPAQPTAINGSASICASTSNTYSITAVAGATSYTWTLPGGWTGNSTTNSITANAGSTNGNITVKANNSCGSSVLQTKSITVNSSPVQPASITGNASICAASSNIYSITAVAGATSYTWTIPNGWTGNSTTNSITAIAGSTNGNITVKANNSCGSSALQTKSIIVNSSPAQPAIISGNANTCAASSNIYSITAVAGATSYTWTLPGGWTGNSTTNSITAIAGSTNGSISVTANNSCGSSASQTLNVISNITDTSVIVSGPMLTSNASGAVYQWINCNGNTILSGQINQNYTASISGSYAVIVTKNGCTDTSSCYSMSIVGINENITTSSIHVSPNPNVGKFIVETENTEIESIEIFNLIGEKIFQKISPSSKTEIDLNIHPKGIYFVKLSGKNSSLIKKIIIH
ncbi:MAG: T9SS type A sorting domain-containing protein [Bacteroidales bacterium]